MKRLSLSLLFLFTATVALAQRPDSARAQQFRHEIGFNAMRLLDQLPLIEAPGDQLPYDVFYNFWFSERFGMRLGAGILKENVQTAIPGQAEPRESDRTNMNVRLGLNHNFLRTGAMTINAFADAVWENVQNKTITTTTTQLFGDPIVTTTVKNEEESMGFGGQVGLGINFRIYRNLCLYTEVPLTFITSSSKTRDEVSDDAGYYDVNSNAHTDSHFRITLPATVYLVLRF
jgi:hypothetical protein